MVCERPSLVSRVSHRAAPLTFPHASEKHLAGSDSSRGLLLWQRSEAEVWLDDVDLREELLGLWGLDAWVDNDIVTWNPVDWGGDLVLVTSLCGIPVSFLFSFCNFLWKYAETE